MSNEIAERSADSSELSEALSPYKYHWPTSRLEGDPNWLFDEGQRCYSRPMPESDESLALDSRWPAFFPAPICVVTTADGRQTALEREVGASIVNRFPYVVALSLCREQISSRHYERTSFMKVLESGGVASLQFLPPGETLDKVLHTIATVPDGEGLTRVERCGLETRSGVTNGAPVFTSSYLVYEARLAKPQKDFEGHPIFEQPWADVGSHRIYFLEIEAIQLRQDIARGETQIHWRALPAWAALERVEDKGTEEVAGADGRYQKGYTPNYKFPAANTIGFEFDYVRDGMATKLLPPLPEDQVEVDNDRARWPCFFPSSCGLITSWTQGGIPNVMPCGSTTIVSRRPLIIAPCVSYASINERYAARESLDIIRQTKRFGCGVPFVDDQIVQAIKYAGNNSIAHDLQKFRHSGLSAENSVYGPRIKEVPIHFDCEVIDEIRLGTHIMFLGKVVGIKVRSDVSPENPVEWCPWPDVVPVQTGA